MKAILTILVLTVVSSLSLIAQDGIKPSNCSKWADLEKNKNKTVTTEGLFRKYTPEKKGKGAGHMFWDWEILMVDGTTVPVSTTNKKINYKEFEGKKVAIKGLVFYGVIIGSSNPNEQSATGYRIDPVEIIAPK